MKHVVLYAGEETLVLQIANILQGLSDEEAIACMHFGRSSGMKRKLSGSETETQVSAGKCATIYNLQYCTNTK